MEKEPRLLRVKGRSGIDPDVLVAHFDGDDSCVWIVDDGSDNVPPKRVCSRARGRNGVAGAARRLLLPNVQPSNVNGKSRQPEGQKATCKKCLKLEELCLEGAHG